MAGDGADGDRRLGPAAAPDPLARLSAPRHDVRSSAHDADGGDLRRPDAPTARPAAPLRTGACPPLPPSRTDAAALSPTGGRAAPRGVRPVAAPAQRGPAPDGCRYRHSADPLAADGPARAAGGAGGVGLSGPGGGGPRGRAPPNGLQPGADTASRPRAQRRAQPDQPAVDPPPREAVPPAARPHRPAPPAGLPGGGRCRPATPLRKATE